MEDSQVTASDNTEFKLFMAMADKAKYLFVDTESNGQPVKDGRGHAIGLSLDFCLDSYNAYSYYFPFRHRPGRNLSWSYRDQLKRLIEDPNKVKISHNTRFDIISSKTLGIDYGMNFEDTMLLVHNVDENKFAYGLDPIARELGYDGKLMPPHLKKMIELEGWDGIPASALAQYAANDASLLRPIFEHYKPIYDGEDESNGELWEYDKKFMLVLNEMERIGAKVDLELAEREVERGRERMRELNHDVGYNIGSTDQLKHLLFDIIGLPVNDHFRSKKTGKPSLDKKALAYYDDLLQETKSPLAQQILEYRGYQKAVSSYWEAYLEHVSPDGRIRPNFNLHRTLTNRLSCNDPNLQQIPRVTAKPWNRLVKSGFIPEDNGWEIWEADYSQLEMRLTAAYAQDQNLMAIFEDDTRDLFNEMAAAMGLPRDNIKTGVYAKGYGAGLDKLASIFGSYPLAMLFDQQYKSNYPGVQKATDMATRRAKGQGFIRYWSTRRRHFYNVNEEAHKAFNSVIQGGAADIVKRIMIRLMENVHNFEECRMILQVHDSVWFEIRKDKVDYYRKEITNIMEDVQPDFGVRFKIDFHKLGLAA